jgi:hypothetical protein
VQLIARPHGTRPAKLIEAGMLLEQSQRIILKTLQQSWQAAGMTGFGVASAR